MKQLLTFLLFLVPISGFAQTQTSWDVSLWGQRRAFTEHVERLAELVEQKTNGQFVMNLSYDGLSTPRNNLGGIANNAFDMAQICAGFHVDKTPSLTVLELPFLGVSNLQQERTISQFLLRQPAVLRDLERHNAIALMPTPVPQQNLVGIGERPNTLSDLAGLQVRATAGTAQAIEVLGAFPTSIGASEVRKALGAKQISAAAFAPHEHMSFGTIASATWWTENLNPGTVNCPVVANINSINNLTPQHRDALYSSINESLDHYIQNYEYNLWQSWEPVLRELNVEKVSFNEAELQSFRSEAAGSAARQWIQENTARGVDAQTLYESVVVALYSGNIEDIPEALPVFTEQKKKQQILDNYAFNRVPGKAPNQVQQPEPTRTFDFNKRQEPQVEDELPVAETYPVEAPESNTRIENIADVTLAALPASASGPTIFSGKNTRPVAKKVARPAAKQRSPEPAPPVAKTFAIDAPKSNPRIENISDVTLAALPASASGPMLFDNKPSAQRVAAESPQALSENAATQKINTYFGSPRNGTAKSLAANPMDVIVEWDLDSSATVGGTLQQLAQYIGYELIDKDISLSVLSRRLPAIHRKVETITVADGFKVISGSGLLTVFNHADRTVRHLQRKNSTNENLSLSVCPDNITLASFSREGVLKLADGSECLFQ